MSVLVLNRGQVPDRGVQRVVLYQWTQRATCHPTSRRSLHAGPPMSIASVPCGTPPSATPLTPAHPSATPGFSVGTPHPRTTGHYVRAGGNLDRQGVHVLISYVAGV